MAMVIVPRSQVLETNNSALDCYLEVIFKKLSYYLKVIRNIPALIPLFYQKLPGMNHIRVLP
jgi:hypothetical protein